MDELVHGQQLHGGDAQIGQVTGHRRLSQAGVGAAELLGYVRVPPGEALYMGLVDDGLVQGVPGGESVPQSKCRSVTTHFGMNGAESESLASSGSSKRCPNTSSSQLTSPSTAVAWGSSSSLAPLQRKPSAGAHGPCTRSP